MATATGPDLSAAKAAVEALMDDEVAIMYNPEDDDELGEDLRYYRGEDVLVYLGRAQIKNEGETSQRWQNGAKDLAVTAYSLGLPLDEAPELRRGMRVHCLSSRRDPQLPGQVFYVQSPVYKTMAVKRQATMTLEVETPAEEG